jgi:DNA repair protein RecO (recombination protein O)
MAAEKSRAIVIRSVAFGETSAVVTLYCREFGKVRALAKGAWRPKSGFDGGLDLLSTAEVLLLRRSSGGLDLLTEACLESRFRVGTSLPALVGGMHVAELLDRLSADADPQPELFDATHATLRRLSGTDAAEARVAAVVVHAELALLALTGHGVAVDECASCGGPLPAAVRTAFGMLDGGGLCGRCRRGRRAVVSVSAGAMDALRRLSRPLVAAAELGPDLGGEVRAIMNAYLTHVLERPPGAGRWLPHQQPPRRRRSG